MEKYKEFGACNCFKVKRMSRHVAQLYDHALSSLGLKNTQFTLLAVLANYSPITIVKMSKVVGVERTTLTRNLKVLERDGLVNSYNGEDQRERFVEISDQGLEMMDKAYPLWKNVQSKMSEKIGMDINTLQKISDKLLELTKKDIQV